MRIYALLTEVGSEYYTEAPTLMSTNPSKLIKILKENKYDCSAYLHSNSFIGYIDFNENSSEIFKTVNFEGDDDWNWKIYEGKLFSYCLKNTITGQVASYFDKRTDSENWIEVCRWREYKNGELIKEYFSDEPD